MLIGYYSIGSCSDYVLKLQHKESAVNGKDEEVCETSRLKLSLSVNVCHICQ